MSTGKLTSMSMACDLGVPCQLLIPSSLVSATWSYRRHSEISELGVGCFCRPRFVCSRISASSSLPWSLSVKRKQFSVPLAFASLLENPPFLFVARRHLLPCPLSGFLGSIGRSTASRCRHRAYPDGYGYFEDSVDFFTVFSYSVRRQVIIHARKRPTHLVFWLKKYLGWITGNGKSTFRRGSAQRCRIRVHTERGISSAIGPCHNLWAVSVEKWEMLGKSRRSQENDHLPRSTCA